MRTANQMSYQKQTRYLSLVSALSTPDFYRFVMSLQGICSVVSVPVNYTDFTSHLVVYLCNVKYLYVILIFFTGKEVINAERLFEV